MPYIRELLECEGKNVIIFNFCVLCKDGGAHPQNAVKNDEKKRRVPEFYPDDDSLQLPRILDHEWNEEAGNMAISRRFSHRRP
jgi:hypothetical protein